MENPCECPFCGYKWQAKVPSPKECPQCKRMLGTLSQAYSHSPEMVKELSEDFDKYLANKKSFEYNPYSNTKYLFTWEEGKVRYQKFVAGIEVRNKLLDSSHEILKDWAIAEFMKLLK